MKAQSNMKSKSYIETKDNQNDELMFQLIYDSQIIHKKMIHERTHI